MIAKIKEDGLYKCYEGDKLLLTITDLGNNTYRAVNKFTDMTAEIIPLEPHKVRMKSIEHKITDKLGRRRESNKLLSSDLNWLWYMLQEKRFKGFEE